MKKFITFRYVTLYTFFGLTLHNAKTNGNLTVIKLCITLFGNTHILTYIHIICIATFKIFLHLSGNNQHCTFVE